MACVAYGCKSHSSKRSIEDEGRTFHRFPDDEELKEIWTLALHRKNWKPTQYSRLCSDHFAPQCYKEGKKRKTLHRYAVPTIFQNYPSYLQKKIVKMTRKGILHARRKVRVTERNSQSIFVTGDIKQSQVSTLKKSIKQQNFQSTCLNKLKYVQQKCRRLKERVALLEDTISQLKSNKNNESTQVSMDEDGEKSIDFLGRHIIKKTVTFYLVSTDPF